MGRLIAGVIALAIGVLGAMYWGQAQQADASQHLPLVPSIEAPVADLDNGGTQADGAEQCPYLKEQSEKGSCTGSSGGCTGGGCCGGCKRGESQTSTT